jgi:molybdopterin-guanine dinucleotide biosynthesis protein A
MRKLPNILMAGAAGRNLGKTEFLCCAIRELSKTVPVIGIKITTIDDDLADYRQIDDEYLVSIEQPADDNKDTHRMFRSGASKVFWLRVKRPNLNLGIEALFKVMEDEGIDLTADCLVMESGSARNFIEPGLFFIIREHADEMKEGVAAVAHLADRLVTVTGDGWDVLPEDLEFKHERWGLKENAAAIILSGGGSTRMGEDKAVMPVDGQPMLSTVVGQLRPNFRNVLISGSPEKYEFSGCTVIEDLEPDRGPLMGLLSTLKESELDVNFVTTCDVPKINMPFVRDMLDALEGFDAVVPVVPEDRKQPLFAVYRKTVVPAIEQLLADGVNAVHALLDQLNVNYVELDADWYHNLNTHDDVEQYRKTQE